MSWKPQSLHDAYAALFRAYGSLVVSTESHLDEPGELEGACDFLKQAGIVASGYVPSIETLGRTSIVDLALPTQRLVHYRANGAADARLLAQERLGGMYQLLFSSDDLLDSVSDLIVASENNDGGRSLGLLALSLVGDKGFIGLFGLESTESLDELFVLSGDTRLIECLRAEAQEAGHSIYTSKRAYNEAKLRSPGIFLG